MLNLSESTQEGVGKRRNEARWTGVVVDCGREGGERAGRALFGSSNELSAMMKAHEIAA
ncbi:hypothetical protein PT2222_190062 [Paraburkholderia tropica]